MASIFFQLQNISLVNLFVVLTCTASLVSHDEECLALFVFKQTNFHQNYDAFRFQKLDSWRKIKSNGSSTSDCCLFDGVVCSNKGHVIALELSGSSLTGVINSNSTLFKLVHLQTLNLSMNNFVESQIPLEIARLKQLRILDLSSSGFNGEIPNEFSLLVQLSWLDLSGNPLNLQSHGLEYLLQNMSRLEHLDLSGVNLASSVPRFLANFSSLRYIELSDSRLKDEFPSAIFHLPKLQLLDVGGNSNLTGTLPDQFHNNAILGFLSLFGTGFTGTIPKSIGNINHLKVLALYTCSFSGSIPGSLSNLTQLTYLSLYGNELTGLVPSLASLLELTALDLGDNSLEIGSVYGWISKLTKLTDLYLSHMNIHFDIFPYLANLTKLSSVSIKGNFIFGRIPNSFMNLTQLQILDFQQNLFQGQISSTFLNFKSLEYLNLDNNEFSGTVGLDSFLGLNKLENLNLNYNYLSFVTTSNYTNATLPELKFLGLASCKAKEFPAFLRFQMKMQELVLSDNEIDGVVPNWIWNNSRETLQIIVLANNFITGFQQHSQSFTMSDQYNNLLGEVPLLMCEVKSLQVIDLSSNKFSGTLPPCLSNLNNSLLVLDLKRNNFHGQMKNICTHGSLLMTIDLSRNRLIGKVSKSLANCTNLEFLSLADNSFRDVFPVWLGDLPNLQVLILRSNNFYGPIQGLSTNSSQFSNLRIIDISNNNFSGQLSNMSFQTWNAMKAAYVGDSSAMEFQIPLVNLRSYLFRYSMILTNKGVTRKYEKILNIFTAMDLSCNNFEGQIPQSLQDLHGLESLNLSNNHFTGQILPLLGSLKNLESLDLCQNELSGQIPQELLQLPFLEIFNVSFNHLDGRIPEGNQFNTFENNSYLANPGLCGKPLSRKCEDLNVPLVLPPTNGSEYESLLPRDRIDWIVILLGVGTGFVIGVVIGNVVYAWHGDWLIDRFGVRKERWVRPLRNTRRN